VSLRIISSLLALSVIAAPAVDAATVSPVAGEVRVSEGQGFQPITGSVELAAGAEVMVGPGGSATIAYADGCVVAVKPGSLGVVRSASPCAGLSQPRNFTPRAGEEWITSVTLPPSEPPQGQTSASTATGDGKLTSYVIVGGVALGTGVIAAVLASQGGDDPVSP
jgi:hypothetical protein